MVSSFNLLGWCIKNDRMKCSFKFDFIYSLDTRILWNEGRIQWNKNVKEYHFIFIFTIFHFHSIILKGSRPSSKMVDIRIKDYDVWVHHNATFKIYVYMPIKKTLIFWLYFRIYVRFSFKIFPLLFVDKFNLLLGLFEQFFFKDS